MMKGYDKQEAIAYMIKTVDRHTHSALAAILDSLIADAIDADIAFMHATGVLDENGNAGANYYDDDDAFETILDALATKHKLGADAALTVAAFLEDFFDMQQNYLESKGLVDWD